MNRIFKKPENIFLKVIIIIELLKYQIFKLLNLKN
jgi:hypothetical protein